MGYEKVEFVNVDFKNILTGLQDKKYDMAVAALSITPERERLADFSEAYAEDGYKVIVSKNSKLGDDFAALAGKTVVAEEGSYAEELLKSKAKDVKVVPVRDTEAGIKLVAEGKADACLLYTSRRCFHRYFGRTHGLSYFRPHRQLSNLRDDFICRLRSIQGFYG